MEILNCFMVTHQRSGGGNVRGNGASALVVRRTAAIGDALAATVVADRLMDMGFEVDYQSHAHCHCVLKLHPRLGRIEVPGGPCHVDLDNAYEHHPNRRQLHYHAMFFEKANAQLKRVGISLGDPSNCRPRVALPLNRKEATQSKLAKYPRPWVMICPRSDSFACRQVPDGIWLDAAAKVNGTCFWLGRHPGPPNVLDIGCRHFDTVLEHLTVADLLATVETGPMHVAAAMGIPCVVVTQATDAAYTLNDQNDFVTVSVPLDCLHCQKTLCPKNALLPPCQQVDPSLLAATVNSRLSARYSEDVSAVVAIYQPEPQTLNHCLSALLPQVQEIIVTGEGNSVIPAQALKHEKIRYVQKAQRRIGYGRNANFGARHSNGKYLLLINDDVFLDEHAVARMLDEMKDGVGAVSNFLRYPSGQIYHAGKVRSPGTRGWGHLDHRQYHPSWKEPLDVENMCGACCLVRREAFYQIGGFDEDFFLYAEDDAFMLSLRKSGWRLRYTPHSSGIHMEGQSTRKLGQPNEYVSAANHIFNLKWGPYLDWNLNRIPGNFDYLRS
jgi:N-acetylglucosaminyl-diphospho-decaprenol L-rhamnosyltransferase